MTAGLQAQIALRDLNAMQVPPSMESLVDETERVLQMMVQADREEKCGPAMTESKDTHACSSTLGTRMMSHTLLSSQLEKGPRTSDSYDARCHTADEWSREAR